MDARKRELMPHGPFARDQERGAYWLLTSLRSMVPWFFDVPWKIFRCYAQLAELMQPYIINDQPGIFLIGQKPGTSHQTTVG